MTPATTCRICGVNSVSIDLDLGTASVSSRFPTLRDQLIPQMLFRLGSCNICGLVQLIDSPDPAVLRPENEWTHFRDPERHLDDLCAAILGQNPSQDSLVMGLTYKDAPFLERLQRAGITRTILLDRTQDWGLISPRDGIETIQRALTPEWAKTIRNRYGPADVLCARHILEHSHDVSAFLSGCQALLAPGGWVLFETPGCETELARGDPGALWEEHVMYFTSTTLRRALQKHGFDCRLVGNYPYAVEDCLAVWARFDGDTRACLSADALKHENSSNPTGTDLIEEFNRSRERLRGRFQDAASWAASMGRRLALWGAGHRTVTLVELLPARDLIDCIIDDDAAKQGRYLPGSDIPILSSTALKDRSIGLCVGILNPDVMNRIVKRLPIELTSQVYCLTLSEFTGSADFRTVHQFRDRT